MAVPEQLVRLTQTGTENSPAVSSLNYLDLRDNKITIFNGAERLSCLPADNLFIDGNPRELDVQRVKNRLPLEREWQERSSCEKGVEVIQEQFKGPVTACNFMTIFLVISAVAIVYFGVL